MNVSSQSVVPVLTTFMFFVAVLLMVTVIEADVL